MGVELRTVGTTSDYAPRIKRATHVLSDGRSAVVVPDTNRSDANGDDVTGTAKIFVYLSTDAERTAYTQAIAYTPASAPSSSTRAFVGSSCIRQDNNLYVVYQAADNSLRLITWVWGGSSWGAGSEQTVIAANAVTNRFRSVDIDALATNANIAVAVYEASASSGVGAWARVYIRLNDGTTWRKAHEQQIFTSQTIRVDSEDVSLAWDRGGAVSNVATLALYFTKRNTLTDSGDTVKEISFNVSTGTDNSASVVGSWYTALNKDIASGTHRGWLYSEANDQWILAASVGTAAPVFMAARLYHNTFTGIVENRTSVGVQFFRDRRFIIYPHNPKMYVTSECRQANVVFGFSGIGVSDSARVARSVVIKLDNSNLANKSAIRVDTSARILDNGYAPPIDQTAAGVLAISGGGNDQNSLAEYNFFIMYGEKGDDVNGSPGFLERFAHACTENTFGKPTLVSPKSNPGVNRPQLVATMQNTELYANVFGKFQFQMSQDSNFIVDVKEITQADTEYQSFSSTDGQTRPSRTVSIPTPVDQALDVGGFWFIRCRIVDDLGGFSEWGVGDSFTLTHPPTALPVSPRDSSTMAWTTGDMQFKWAFSDTETTDSQTAYQLVITRTDTGAVVVDTGKVVSASMTATVDIPEVLIGVQLQWVVALWDQYDDQGVFSQPTLFTALERPIPVITNPVRYSTIDTGVPTVEWAFYATNDRIQRAFRILVWDLDASPDVVVGDTGWITSTEQSYTFPSTVLQDLGSYRVVVQVMDNTGMRGSSESNDLGNHTFDENVLGWTPDTGAIAFSTLYTRNNSTGSMEVTPANLTAMELDSDMIVAIGDERYYARIWVYTPTGLAEDVALNVVQYDSAGAEIASNGSIINPIPAGTWTEIEHYTGVVDFATAFLGIRIELPATILSTDILYFDDAELIQEPQYFDTDFTEPIGAGQTVVGDEFKATITWDNTNIDPDFLSWRVYRRYMKVADSSLDVNDTANTWVLIYETTENLSSYEYRDYFAPLNRPIDYLVVQMVDRFGALLESPLTGYSTITLVGDRYYFVPEVPIGAIASFEAKYVTSDSFTREIEQETIHIIQRGRQVQVGDDLGYLGSFTVQLRDPSSARLDREFLEYLSTPDSSNVYIRSPFGDVLYVSIGNVSTQRLAGVGTSDLADLTVPYSEVFGDVPVTRTQ